MVDYRKLKIGDKIVLRTRELDGQIEIKGNVTSVLTDHTIMHDGEFGYWIDDDTAE